MLTGMRYRVVSMAGVAALTLAAVLIASHPPIQELLGAVTPAGGLQPVPLMPGERTFAAVVAAVGMTVAFVGLSHPRPWRAEALVSRSLVHLSVGVALLATVGYFDYTYRLPRLTLLGTAVLLVGVLPAWFWVLQRLRARGTRALVVTDAAGERPAPVDAAVVGVLPLTAVDGAADTLVLNGGYRHHITLGERWSLSAVLRQHDITRVRIDAASPRLGIELTAAEAGVEVRYSDPAVTPVGVTDPWTIGQMLSKRSVDLICSLGGLVLSAPLILVVAVAVRLVDGSPVVYTQLRTGRFGHRFRLYKFRTMRPDAEADSGPMLSPADIAAHDQRITRLGRLLRRFHLDELPQLVNILLGEMSMVGPRPERPALDRKMVSAAPQWPHRWAVRPGLTGLAQVRGITGFEPRAKLRADLEYIATQNLRVDFSCICAQVVGLAAQDGNGRTGTGNQPPEDARIDNGND